MIVYVSDGDGVIGRGSGQLWGRCWVRTNAWDGRSFVSTGGTLFGLVESLADLLSILRLPLIDWHWTPRHLANDSAGHLGRRGVVSELYGY